MMLFQVPPRHQKGLDLVKMVSLPESVEHRFEFM